MATKQVVRKRGWTLTADKLPPVGKRVLVQSFSSSGVAMEVARRKRPFYDRGKMQRNRWEDNTGRDLCYYVEYWRPLPAAASCQHE
jgi:hypothetical protein